MGGLGAANDPIGRGLFLFKGGCNQVGGFWGSCFKLRSFLAGQRMSVRVHSLGKERCGCVSVSDPYGMCMHVNQPFGDGDTYQLGWVKHSL